MSAARMTHEQLEGFAARLAELRDQSIAEKADNPTLSRYFEGEAQAFDLALSALHAWSDGAYGEPYSQGEQGGAGK